MAQPAMAMAQPVQPMATAQPVYPGMAPQMAMGQPVVAPGQPVYPGMAPVAPQPIPTVVVQPVPAVGATVIINQHSVDTNSVPPGAPPGGHWVSEQYCGDVTC